MKNFYLTCAACLFVLTAVAQESKDISIEKAILKQSLVYGDNSAAVNSIYAIIAKEGKTSSYKDSLAYLYFSGNRFSSCFMVCTDILAQNSGKLEILEMQAVSLDKMGAFDKAAQAYAKLTSKTNNNYHAYKLANLNVSMKKYPEAMVAVKKAESLNDTGKIQVTYNINKNYTQQVSLLAAIANVRGIIEFELDKLEAAKVSFQKAIKLQDDFVLAKENLQAVIAGKKVKKE